MVLECCVNSAVSAIMAQLGGADRVELCENMADGGCTPSAGTIILARKHLTIPIFVMIRPRGADFLYSDEEVEIMRHDIRVAKELGADGVVFGILMPDGRMDSMRMKELVKLARPMGVTCHRAFDMTRDPMEAIDDLIEIGVDRVLTSGQTDSALEGASLINRLIRHAGNKITIMPGHGVKENNLMQVVKETGATEFHMYLTKEITGGMNFIREGVKMGKPDLSEYTYVEVDSDRVREAHELLNNYKTM
ncbi:MAG: copper homeostasis protein CutC [Bacteroidales bacterium]|nr:copper homeostasis protein CutC [Bacteroidales bacterium]